jgi:hypothetical protein
MNDRFFDVKICNNDVCICPSGSMPFLENIYYNVISYLVGINFEVNELEDIKKLEGSKLIGFGDDTVIFILYQRDQFPKKIQSELRDNQAGYIAFRKKIIPSNCCCCF